jgi:glycosidase
MRWLIPLLFVAGCVNPDALDKNWRTTAAMPPDGDWRDEVIYQLLVDRYANGDLNNDFRVVEGSLGQYQGGDWQGVIDHLDYLEELGVTTIWLSPIVRNLETDANFDAYHGYWQQDFTRVNPHYGDLGKLRELVQKAHARGLKVILDIVTNHVGQLFYYDINGNGSPDENTYGAGCGAQPPADKQPCPTDPPLITHITEYDPDYDPQGIRGYTSLGFSGQAPIRWIYIPAINRAPTEPGAGAGLAPDKQRGFQREDWYHRRGRVTNYGEREQVLTGDFPGGLKDLATERDDVADALTAAFAHWIQAADFDGFRIDTLKHVDHGFWQKFCSRIRQYTAGKIELPDPLAGLAEGLDEPRPNQIVPPLTVPKNKFFMFGESFDGNDDLNSSYTYNGEVDSTFYFSQKFSVFDAVFKRGEPTKRIEEQFQRKQTKYNPEPHPDGVGLGARDVLVNFMDNHDVTRFLFDKPSLPALWNALAFLFTEDGIPCLYYGTEQEFYGGNDPFNRERLWDTGFRTDGATFLYIKKLIKIRKAYAPLRRGQMAITWSTERVGNEQDAGIFAFERRDAGKTVLVVLNTHETKTSETSASTTGGMPMMTSFPAGTQLRDVLDESGVATFVVGAGGQLTVSVPARGQRILVPVSDVVALD